MDAQKLKQQLQQIRLNQLSIDDVEHPYELALNMMLHIGSPDSVLRDELIYITLATWIGQDVFSEAQLRHLLQLALDDQHLFYEIGEQGTDSVFTRTFSVLLVPAILKVDRQLPFLEEEDIKEIHTRLTTYLRREKDVRGYVDDKGWAHAPAHAADAVEDLAQSSYLARTELLELLDAITMKITEPSAVYIYDEDQRIAHAIISILRRDVLEPTDISAWVDSFAQGNRVQHGSLLENSQLDLNVRLFLQTLYFAIRTEVAEPYETVRVLVLKALEEQ